MYVQCVARARACRRPLHARALESHALQHCWQPHEPLPCARLLLRPACGAALFAATPAPSPRDHFPSLRRDSEHVKSSALQADGLPSPA